MSILRENMMTKLNKLINEFCPGGVEYVELKTVCNIYDGTHQTPNYTDDGIKFVSVENINDLYSTKKFISEKDFESYKIKPKIDDVLMTRIGSIGVCTVVDRNEPLAYYVSLALLRPNTTIFNSKFLKYAIESLHGRKELRKRTLVNAVPIKVNKDDIGKITIPIPPLPVQAEIVRILDNFTELTAELTAELTTRKKQYEYYTNYLLSFDDNITRVKLRDIVFFKNGKGHEKNIVDNGKYIVVNSKFISTNGVTKKFSDNQACPLYKDDILMVMSDLPNGKALAKCFLVEEDNLYTLNQRIGSFHVKDFKKTNTKFLYYVLNRNYQLLKYDNGVDQTNLRKDDILDIDIPIPSVEKQELIVSMLDRFDKLCKDMSEGLPAEITARQKQYEYYRDKLLTFKELTEEK